MKSVITSVFFLFVLFSISSPVLAGEESVCSEIVEEVEKNSVNYHVINSNKEKIFLLLADRYKKDAEYWLDKLENTDEGNHIYIIKRMNENLEMNRCLTTSIKCL